MDLIDTKGHLTEQAGLEYYNGILVPGFINCHCHLELSHLKNKIDMGTGLGEFIGAVNKLRFVEEEIVMNAARNADAEMWKNGIVAVGDVSNGFTSLEIKRESKLDYYTFVEVFGFLSERAERAFKMAGEIYRRCESLGLKASIVPHSPYSVSGELFGLIRAHAEKNKGLISIHNQESKAENFFFLTGEGEIAGHLQNNIGLNISGWKPTGKNSLPSVLDKIPEKNQLLLVHNTFTAEDDIRFLKEKRDICRVFFVLCPNANLYISKSLPPVGLFRSQNLNLCFGTDSLASNSQLSIVAEMYTIQENFKETGFNEILTWATLNGARALKMNRWLGSFEKGKRPGVNLLVKTNLHQLKLTPETRVQRLA